MEKKYTSENIKNAKAFTKFIYSVSKAVAEGYETYLENNKDATKDEKHKELVDCVMTGIYISVTAVPDYVNKINKDSVESKEK